MNATPHEKLIRHCERSDTSHNFRQLLPPNAMDVNHGSAPTPLHLTNMLFACAITVACGGGNESTNINGKPPENLLHDQSGCFFQYTPGPVSVRTGADPLVGQQWHLNNTGQDGGIAGEDVHAFPAWFFTRGAGTRVAVIDDALDVLHEDLFANIVPLASYSYRPGSAGSSYPLPCSGYEVHGTAVAGLVAARAGNAVGGVGAAPEANIVGYNALVTHFEADLADALTRDLERNAVYHNSWGAPDNGSPNPVSSVIKMAIEDGITSGRNGKGAVYVFAGGNGGCYARTNGGECQHETTGLDGYLNQLGVMAIGSVDHQGKKPYFAEPGANLLVCAPTGNSAGTSSITTTSAQNSYRSDFSGASASAPTVSGVVALMLSANPRLSWRDVRLILAQTARQNDLADAGWMSGPASRAYNHKYGFGVVDAAAAVSAARSWNSVGGSDRLLACGPYERTPNLTLPDATGTDLQPQADRVNIGPECAISKIEYVEVSFTATHPYAGDLRLRLLSPLGLTSELVDQRTCSGTGDACGPYSDWRFSSVRHLGESAVGNWTLQVTDAQEQDTGTWERWALRIWGR